MWRRSGRRRRRSGCIGSLAVVASGGARRTCGWSRGGRRRWGGTTAPGGSKGSGSGQVKRDGGGLPLCLLEGARGDASAIVRAPRLLFACCWLSRLLEFTAPSFKKIRIYCPYSNLYFRISNAPKVTSQMRSLICRSHVETTSSLHRRMQLWDPYRSN